MLLLVAAVSGLAAGSATAYQGGTVAGSHSESYREDSGYRSSEASNFTFNVTTEELEHREEVDQFPEDFASIRLRAPTTFGGKRTTVYPPGCEYGIMAREEWSIPGGTRLPHSHFYIYRNEGGKTFGFSWQPDVDRGYPGTITETTRCFPGASTEVRQVDATQYSCCFPTFGSLRNLVGISRYAPRSLGSPIESTDGRLRGTVTQRWGREWCPTAPAEGWTQDCRTTVTFDLPNPFDRDDDGVPDAEDGCADEAGDKRLNGCPDLVSQYAPHVYLHPDEAYWPTNARQFIGNAFLGFAHRATSGCRDLEHVIKNRGTVDPARLGSDAGSPSPYWHNIDYANGSFCDHAPERRSTAQYTRPRGEDRPSPFDGTGDRRGFFLDIADETRGGLGDDGQGWDPDTYTSDAPLYYQRGALAGGRSYITYWFFSAYSQFAINELPDQAHEGDWERVSILFDSDKRPERLAYYRHDPSDACGDPGYEEHDWSTVSTESNGHPVVFTAKGSHASYPTDGSHPISVEGPFGACSPTGTRDVTRRDGKVWETWNADRVNVADEPWYGYGGAWGQVGKFPFTTGPLGPGPQEDAPGKSPYPAHFAGQWD